MSGAQVLDVNSVSEEVVPLKIQPQGNYGVAVVWSDGHDSSIYSFKRLADIYDAYVASEGGGVAP